MTLAWRPWLYFGPAALIAGGLAVALTATSDHEQHPGLATALVLFVSWSFILAGLIGWTRRPQNRTGKLMVGVGFGVLIGVLGEANHSIPYTLGALFGSLFVAAFVHLLLAYPSGRLMSRHARMLVGAGYAIAFLASLLDSLFATRQTCKPHACSDNLVLVSHDHTAHVVATAIWTVASVVLFAAVVMLLVGRWRRTTPGLRRILRSVYLFGGLSVVLLAIGFVVTPFSGVGAIFVSVALIATFTTVPFIFLAGLLGTAIARGAGVGAIFSSIPERASPGEVQEGLRTALRDETAVVAYWYDEDEHYVDVEGNRIDLPEDTRRRVVTRLNYGDQPVAAIVHDAALLQEPELLEGIANAARIALERDKLLVEVRARAQRYRALLQAMPDLMFRISRDGRYISYMLALPSHLIAMDSNVSAVVLLIGLAVGVDYSLFYLKREREERAAGRSAEAALEAAAATSGRSVLISGVTVIFAMGGMFFSGDKGFMSFAVATMTVVAIAMLGSLTVLPAVMSKLGGKVEKGRIPYLGRLRRNDGSENRVWSAILTPALRRPLISAVIAGAALAALAFPVLGVHTAISGLDSLPNGTKEVQAIRAVQDAFPGGPQPAVVVVKAKDVRSPSVSQANAGLKREALASGQMLTPIEVTRNHDNTVAQITIPLVGKGTDAKSNAALTTLRDRIVPATIGKADGTEYAVTGITAASHDFNSKMKGALPYVFGFVLAFTFLLLLVSFRSVVIAAKAIVLNLLSVGAAYGVLVLVFQKGWGEGILGFKSNGGIASWLPLFMFVILFRMRSNTIRATNGAVLAPSAAS